MSHEIHKSGLPNAFWIINHLNYDLKKYSVPKESEQKQVSWSGCENNGLIPTFDTNPLKILAVKIILMVADRKILDKMIPNTKLVIMPLNVGFFYKTGCAFFIHCYCCVIDFCYRIHLQIPFFK